MFSEKNIPKLIILSPIITVILIAIFIIYFFVQNQNNYFEEESRRAEHEYLLNQKNILKKEVNSVISYLSYHQKKEIKKVSKDPVKRERELEQIKMDLIKYIETIRYEHNGYIWIHDTSYYLVAHPFRQDSIGQYDINLRDATGTLITKKFIDETLKQPQGNFIEYNWAKPKEKFFSKKLGYFKLYKDFSWVIGAGLYIDDIQETIAHDKALLEDRINKYIRLVVLICFAVILVIGFLSFIVSNKITKVFALYKDKVKKKENLLERLNLSLETKVQEAISDVKKKDRAMLHQSRLARMGVMLSMIAHQWRQPLSKIASILMELETATKFKESSDEKVFSSIRQSNKQLFYMSNTIDDFRNFFKPDKEKIDFYIEVACLEAISLTHASITNIGIKLIKDINYNIKINGYEREFAQVILNLLSNAKDVLNERNIKEPKIFISIKKMKDEVLICVEDNARGVNEEHLELVFEPYFTTKGSLKGTGLGLYMSKMIIEKNMDGSLSLENTARGALFTISLKV